MISKTQQKSSQLSGTICSYLPELHATKEQNEVSYTLLLI